MRFPFTKKANYTLSGNPDFWLEEIFEYIVRNHPYLTDLLPGSIEWKTGNNVLNKGVAIGIITIGKDNNIGEIPVIVENNELKPIDVIIYRGKYYPIQEKIISEFFSDSSLGKASVPNETPYRFADVYGPGEIVNGGLSKLSEIANSRKKLRLFMPYDKIKKLATQRHIKKIAQQEISGRTVHLVSRDTEDVLPNVKTYENGKLIKRERFDLNKHANYKKDGIYYGENYRPSKYAAIKEIIVVENDDAETDSFYTVFDSDYQPHVGKFMDMRKLDGENGNENPEKFFVSTEGVYFVNPQNYTKYNKQTKPKLPVFEDGKLSAGELVLLQFDGHDGFYGPYEIERDVVNIKGERKIYALNKRNGRVVMSPSEKFSAIVPVSDPDILKECGTQNVFVTPKIDKVIKLKKMCGSVSPSQLTNYVSDKASKVTSSVFTVKKDYGDMPELGVEATFFVFENGEKIASLPYSEAKAMLMSLGSTSELADFGLKYASKNGKATFVGLYRLTHKKIASEKTASGKSAKWFIETYKKPIKQFAKLASELFDREENAEEFSENMMDEKKVIDYREAIDLFEEAINYLAKMLIDKRIGSFPEISEQVIKAALNNLYEIYNGLLMVDLEGIAETEGV
jgi:hypothetical protein